MSIALEGITQNQRDQVEKRRGQLAIIRAWLTFVLALIAAMVVVGGATRLTDSGLSITEWKPILGAIPPLNAADWAEAFDKYRQIPEYQQINKGMSLEAFQFIYWWEWGHRFLGRIIGLVFFVPAVIFWALGWFSGAMKLRVTILFLLGGLQGVIGWWMVTSGLVDRVDVSQYRLAIHLTLACILFAGVLWFAMGLSGKAAEAAPGSALSFSYALVALVFVQIFAGALVAGMDAGLYYNSWPLIDEALVPDGLLEMSPFWLNAFENIKTVQFDHRMMAYGLFVLAAGQLLWAWRGRFTGRFRLRAGLFLLALTGQMALGIYTLLWAVPLDLALMHQFGALVVLGIAVWHTRALKGGYSEKVTLLDQK